MDSETYLERNSQQQFQRPEFRGPLSNVKASVGDSIKLECQMIGNPKPSLSWKLNGKTISDGEHYKVS